MWRRIGQGSYRCRGCWPRRGQNMVSKSHGPYNICFRTLFPAQPVDRCPETAGFAPNPQVTSPRCLPGTPSWVKKIIATERGCGQILKYVDVGPLPTSR